MPTCPKCGFEFHEGFLKQTKTTKIVMHECVSGYIRPYSQAYCTDCRKLGARGDDLVARPEYACIENRKRKAAYFDLHKRRELANFAMSRPKTTSTTTSTPTIQEAQHTDTTNCVVSNKDTVDLKHSFNPPKEEMKC